jgi:hypothetical protein
MRHGELLAVALDAGAAKPHAISSIPHVSSSFTTNAHNSHSRARPVVLSGIPPAAFESNELLAGQAAASALRRRLKAPAIRGFPYARSRFTRTYDPQVRVILDA